jgi:hypothetical protein
MLFCSGVSVFPHPTHPALQVRDDEKFDTIAQPANARAPEVMMGHPWSYPVDVWSVGCLVGCHDFLFSETCIDDFYRHTSS